MVDPFSLADAMGPAHVTHIHVPSAGLKAIVVVDNVARGPAIGGARMAPDVSLQECARLARAMTLKNAAAGLPHGGGKSVIFADPRMPPAEKEQLVRCFADAIAHITDYIVGPDMGTDETCMAWIQDEIGRSVGLPPALGGIPLDEIGATGFGLVACIDVAREACGLQLQGATVAVQGFGAVGKHAARFLAERGARLVAASDSKGTIIDTGGLDVQRLIALKGRGGGVLDYDGGSKAGPEAVIDVACDIWIPAARPDVIDERNVDRLKARLVAQGANIPITHAAERRLADRGILSLPDFIANAGGVICAAAEYHGATQTQAFAMIDERIRANTRAMLDRATAGGITPRAAAVELAQAR
ncbi:MAG: Glu/Leu/Phe/Val dehydrogenase, partial [Alphaproteobacteria bacterium]|nr:Glu/Leu/Phe/Val dehydrogenase [Alphaproteobacteria bacterium]